MSEESVVEALEEDKDLAKEQEKEKFNFKKFITNRTNIIGVVCVLTALIAIGLYVILPVISITLTPEGKALASNNAATIPAMADYFVRIRGFRVLLGMGQYGVWHNVGTSAVYEYQQLQVNIPLIIALVLLLAGAGLSIYTCIRGKFNWLNKLALFLSMMGAVMILITPAFFYAVNPITASTRYTQALTLYEFGSINAHGHPVGTILTSGFALISTICSGLLLPKPVETR